MREFKIWVPGHGTESIKADELITDPSGSGVTYFYDNNDLLIGVAPAGSVVVPIIPKE